jgi:hypothetical protein
LENNTNLFPSKADIEDKGKADLLVKLLAVTQISWLVLSVIVRGITRLPVSQLEITSLAFSVISVWIYIANLWKPKDVLTPIRLRILGPPGETARSFGSASERHLLNGEEKARSQVAPFFEILLHPSRKRDGEWKDVPRVSNDTFRHLGFVPLISTVTAMSSLVFGGLHCIAWSFEFPSRAEVLIWRIASIASATIPCIALLVTAVLAWLINSPRRSLITLLRLEQYPPTWWASFDPESPIRGQFEGSLANSGQQITGSERRNWEEMYDFFIQWHWILNHAMNGPASMVRYQLRWACQIASNRGSSSPSWKMYEDFVRKKFEDDEISVPDGYFLEHFLAQKENATQKVEEIEPCTRRCDRFSSALTLIAGIVYTIARVSLLVIAFTSLRSVPKDLYENSWTRLIPYIS